MEHSVKVAGDAGFGEHITHIDGVRSGYQFSNAKAALKGISAAPLPQSNKAKRVATPPMAPKTRCPVSSMSIIEVKISIAISS
jgi:hypothetical protein